MRRYTVAIPAAIASATAFSLAGDLPDEAKARGHVDVKAVSVANPPPAASLGGSFTVAWRASRSGRSPALKKARLVFRLSADRRRDRADLKLGRGAALSKLVRKQAVSGRARLTIPASARATPYYLLACVEGKGLRDRRPANDCRAAKSRVTVVHQQGPGGGPAPGDSGGGGGGPTALNVTPTLDTGSSTFRYIPTTGGSLSTTDSNGTQYTLTLPADALFSGTVIRMTPVTSLAGMPGGLIGAVKLEPEGLVLNAPATLEVEPLDPTTVPADRQVAFTSEGGGQDFHLLHDPNGGLSFDIVHFSAPGVSDMSSSDVANVESHTPVRSQAQFEAALEKAYRAGDVQGTISLSRSYYTDVVRPQLQSALTSDDAMDAAFAAAFSWKQLVTLFGLETGVQAEMDEWYDLMSQVLQNAAARAWSRCMSHDITAVHRMIQVERIAHILMFADDASYADTMDKVAKCLQFELDFDSDATLDFSGDVTGSFHYHLHALDTALSTTGPDDHAISGTNTLSWLDFSGSLEWSGECASKDPPDNTFQASTTAQSAADSTMRATLSVDLSPREPGAPQVDPLNAATVELDTGPPIETYHYVTTGCLSQNTTGTDTVWDSFFGAITSLTNGVAKGPGLTVFTKLERGTGDNVLNFTIDTDEENTTIRIYHHPQP